MSEHEDDINPADVSEKSTEKPFGTNVRRASSEDLVQIKSILERWVKDMTTGQVEVEEIDEMLRLILESINGENERIYFVAEDSGDVVGIAGICPPEKDMTTIATTEKPIELKNLFVSEKIPGKRGTGSLLLNAVSDSAKKLGYTEILVNSGPRYKESAWGFYDKKFGERAGLLKDHYGAGLDAPVWRKELI